MGNRSDNSAAHTSTQRSTNVPIHNSLCEDYAQATPGGVHFGIRLTDGSPKT